MLKYALRNVLHYRSKYAIAFVLISVFSSLLALSLFAFNGFWNQAAIYARSMGDISFSVNQTSLDSVPKPPDGQPPSKRLEKEAVAFFTKELKAERVVPVASIGGDAYAQNGSWSVAATSLETIRQLFEVDLAEGGFPDENEALLPVSMRSSLKIGDAITFVFKNSDLILDSQRFRVCGFFLPTRNTENLIFLSQSQFSLLDVGRVPGQYFVFLHGRTGRDAFLSAAECKKDYRSFVSFLARLSGYSGKIDSGYYSAGQRYDESKTLIQFFELMVSIFLFTLIVIAVAVIINVVFTSLVDRIKIVGTFLAYGMRHGAAVLLLASEMLVFSAIACSVGLAIAFALVSPLSGLQFTADNWTIAVILGGKRSLTITPALWAVAATYCVGMLVPFLTSAASSARMLRGEIVGLLHYAK